MDDSSHIKFVKYHLDTDLSPFKYFLEIKVTEIPHGYLLSQKYTPDMFVRVCLSDSYILAKPIQWIFSLDLIKELLFPTLIATDTGLIYLYISCPNIVYVGLVLSLSFFFDFYPFGPPHVFSLLSSRYYPLDSSLCCSSSVHIRVYSNASWPSDPVDRCSIIGFLVIS